MNKIWEQPYPPGSKAAAVQRLIPRALKLLSRGRDWVSRYPLAGLMFIALVLRLVEIGNRSLQYDDVFSIFIARRSLAEIVSGTAADTMPPLFYFLLHFWLMLGNEVWLIRLLSVMINLVSLVLLFGILANLFDRKSALWAVFLAAISPLQVYHAQDIRMYALLQGFQLGYLWFFTRVWTLRGREKIAWANWGGMVFCAAGAMYTHNLAVFGLVVPGLLVLLRRDWKFFAHLALSYLATGLLVLPWLLMVPGQIQKIQGAFWTPRPGLVEVLQSVIQFTVNLPLPPVLLALAAVLSLQILVIVLIESWKARRAGDGILFLAFLLIVPPALLFLMSYLMRPIFVTRGFLVSSLALDGLGGLAIASGWRRGIGKVLALAFVLAAALSLPYFYNFNSFPRSPYLEATQSLQNVAAPGIRVVHDNKLSYFPSEFYAPGLPQVFIADPPGSENDTFAPASQQAMQIYPQPDLATAVGSSQEIYFIVYSETIAEYRALGLPNHPALDWLDEHFSHVGRQTFNDLEIYHFQR